MKCCNGWLLAALCILSPALHAAPDELQAYRQGVQSFRAGDFQTALKFFLEARRAGETDPALDYSLGSTYYRLGRYAESRNAFKRLIGLPEWRALAHYNLGLIARRQGDEIEAVRQFQQARDQSADPQLIRLAQRMLENVPRKSAKPAPPWFGLASLGAGYDDNVTLSPDADLVGVSDNEDAFVELLAAGSGHLYGGPTKGLRLLGGVYLREYETVDRFDQTALRAGLLRDRARGAWETAIGALVDRIYLDGETFEDVGTLSLEGERALYGGRELHLRNHLSRIEADGDFDYLTGWRNRTQVELSFPLPRGYVFIGYELELNEREDLDFGNEFFSQSPTRHAIYTEASWRLNRFWVARASGEYRRSRYNDDNRLQGVDSFIVERRDEDRYYFSLRAERGFADAWYLFGQYAYIDNDSNFGVFDYARNEYIVGIEHDF